MDGAALAPRLFERALHAVKGHAVNQRPDMRGIVERRSDPQGGEGRGQALDKGFADAVVDDEAAQGGAALAAGSGCRKHRAAQREVEVGAGRDDRGVVAAEFEDRTGEALGEAHCDILSHPHAARRADDRDVGVIGDRGAASRIADYDLHQIVGRQIIIVRRFRQQPGKGERGERGFLRRFPDRAVAAHQCDGRPPRPHRGGEIERRDQAEHPHRVPIFGQAMFGPFGRDGQPEQLARQADGIFADVDDFLHFAARFGQDLAILDREQQRQRLLMLAYQCAIAADQLAAMRGRNELPCGKGGAGVRNHRVDIGGGVHAKRRQLRSVDRRIDRQVGPEAIVEGQAQLIKGRRSLFGQRGGGERGRRDFRNIFGSVHKFLFCHGFGGLLRIVFVSRRSARRSDRP